jgi:hypothetical protein
LFAIFGAITHLIVFNLNPFRRKFGSFVYWVSYTIVFGILYIFAHIVKWFYYLPIISKVGLPVLMIILLILKEYIHFEPFQKKDSKDNNNKKNLTSKS